MLFFVFHVYTSSWICQTKYNIAGCIAIEPAFVYASWCFVIVVKMLFILLFTAIKVKRRRQQHIIFILLLKLS